MKCPKCSVNHPKKEGRICKCGYHFVFNPPEDKGMTDGRFLALINNASRGGNYYFTENQLYASYCRRMGSGLGCTVAAVVAALAVLALWIARITNYIEFGGGMMVGSLVVFALCLLGIFTRVGRPRPMAKSDFIRLARKWVGSGQKVEKLIIQPRLHTPPPTWSETDIYDYGVERVLIVERDLYVDALVLNGFHTQERALVISLNGYPDYLLERARQVLAGAPHVPVYYLHDAEEPAKTSYKMKKAGALVGRTEVIDLGLSAEDARKLKPLKKLPASEWEGRIPVDVFLYTGLYMVLTNAIAQGVPIGQVVHDASSDGGGSSFG